MESIGMDNQEWETDEDTKRAKDATYKLLVLQKLRRSAENENYKYLQRF